MREARASDPTRYQRDLLGYARKECGFTPWESADGSDSQASLFRSIQESASNQLDGLPALHEFSIKSAHGVGKTFGASVIVNWFFDAFPDCIITTTAPTFAQVTDLLWKDIRATRPSWGQQHLMPAEPKMSKSATHFADGKSTSNAGGQGSARAHGRHAKFMLFVLDEADGVPSFYYGAIDGMMTSIAPGQVIIVLRIGNPQSRNSEFHRRHDTRGVQAMHFDALRFPNVTSGENLVPGGTTRDWVNGMIRKHCEATPVEDEASFTFTVDWETEDKNGVIVPAGGWLKPNGEFLWRVRGITPPNAVADTVISEGRYMGALHREVEATQDDVRRIFIGVDMARFGTDAGTVYRRQSLRIRHEASIHGQDSHAYLAEVAKTIDAGMAEARAEGITEGIELSIRVDGTGGFGSGLIDLLKLVEMPDSVTMKVHEVSFVGVASDPASYYDKVTEMYASADDVLAYHRLESDTPELKLDLTDRKKASWAASGSR